MNMLRISLFEDRRVSGAETHSARPFDTRVLPLANAREGVARFLAREISPAIRIRYLNGGVTLEIAAKRPRRKSGPFEFWRRALITVQAGNPYELRVLDIVMRQVMEAVEEVD